MLMRKALALILILLALLVTPVFSTGVDTYCFDLLSETEQLAYQALQDCLIPYDNKLELRLDVPGDYPEGL